MAKISLSYLFPSQDIKQNVLSSYSVDDVRNFKIYLGSSSQVIAVREKKRGRGK